MWSVFVIYAQSRSLPAELSSNPDQTQLNQLKGAFTVRFELNSAGRSPGTGLGIPDLDRFSGTDIFDKTDLFSFFHCQIITHFPRINAILNSLIKSNHGITVISASQMHSQNWHA